MVLKRVFVPLTLLVAAALACGGGGGGGGGGTGPTATPKARVLFKDSFGDSGSGWSTGGDQTGKVDYTSGELVFEILEGNWFIWSNPGEDSLTNAHIAVTARNVGTADDPTFGLICNYENDKAMYYMGIGPDGYYAIVKVDGDNDVFLTSDNNKWVKSDEIDINADQYDLEGVCAKDGTLSLTVNGKEIASVQDTTYTKGDIGLFTLSFDKTPVEVHFDDLVVTDAK